jgi:hypothetical protein
MDKKTATIIAMKEIVVSYNNNNNNNGILITHHRMKMNYNVFYNWFEWELQY